MSITPYCVDQGPREGEAVLFGGSIGSTVAMWEQQVDPLVAAGFRVIRYDHRGHGGSPVTEGPYSIADLAEDVLNLLDSLAVERVHFTGLSLGAMTAMWLAAHNPNRISGLVLCCTSAKLDPVMWAERAAKVRADGCGSIAEQVVSRWVTPEFAERNPDRVAELQKTMASNSAEGYASCCTAIERMDLTELLPRITAPTLVISCAEDKATPPEHGRRIVEGIPGSRIEIVPDAAHLGNIQQPERFNQLIGEHVGPTP